MLFDKAHIHIMTYNLLVSKKNKEGIYKHYFISRTLLSTTDKVQYPPTYTHKHHHHHHTLGW